MNAPVNIWAVLAAAVSSMVLGFLWYGPLFGKTWQRLMGWDMVDAAKKEEMKKGMSKNYALTFLGSLVLAFILSHFLVYAQSYEKVSGVGAAIGCGFWIWLGFMAPLTLGSVLWEGKSWKLWTLNNGYNLIQVMLMAAILASWK